MTATEGRASAADGTPLRTLHWPAERPWAVLLLVHGLGEHAGRYEALASRMAAAGIDVHAYDQRGFGASGGRRAYVDRWGDLHDDLAKRLAAVRSAASTLPLVLYGHSMGGLVVLGYLLDGVPRPLPDRAVVTSPGLDATFAGWKRAIAPLLGRVAPRLRVPNGFVRGALSRDPAVDGRYRADPLNQAASTARLGAEGFAEQRRVRAALAGGARLPVSTYVIHGTADPIVPVDASALLAAQPTVTRRTYPGLRHETHNEPEGPAVIDDTIAWLRSSLAAGRSGPR